MIRVLIADDHEIVREGLKQILTTTTSITVTGEAVDGLEALGKIRQDDYDVIVLDISMPGRSGLEILKQIKTEKPDLPVLILSMYSEEQYAIRAIKSGAAGYLTKETVKHELIQAIQDIASGRRYITSTLADRLAFALESDTEKLPHETLSDREYQVMVKIAAGKSIKEIADELFLSQNTINTYRQRILDKMKMKSNTDLARYTMKHQLID